MSEEDALEGAEKAVDPDRLLAGEDPTSQLLEDAELWVTVYSELTAFKNELVTSTEGRAARMLPQGARELYETDIPVLQAEAERLNRRLQFWLQRRSELSGRPGMGS